MCIDMRSGNFSRYYNTSSIIHSINPLCKILGLLIFTFMVFIGSNFRVICGLSLILFYIIIISNVPFFNYIKSLFGMKFLFIMIFLINLLFGVSVYSSFIMIIRVCFIVLYSSVLLFTTTTNELALGFSSLLRPLELFDISVSKISMALALSFNFVPDLFVQSNKIIKSQASRGFDYNNASFKDKLIGIKSIVIPMFVLSIKRADCISDAMELKQFSFNNNRSSIKSISWCFKDSYMIACHLLIFVFVLVKEVVL